MSFEYCKLGEVIHITSGKECPTEKKTHNSSIPIRGATGIIGYSTEPLYERPVILVGRVGNGLLSGMSGILNRADSPCWPSDNTLVIIPKDDDDFDYIEYCLRYSQIYPYVSGSSQPLLTQTALKLLEIPWPSKESRHMIANHGRQIDQLLMINRKKNSISEEIISGLFRSWFIDFDPVKAKAEGKLPYGMDKETVALFPDSFEDSELGSIPTGWKVKNYSDYMDLKYGGALKAEERVDGEFPVLGSNGIVGKHNEYLVNGPGIVIGRKGNPGTINWINENFFPIDTTFYVQTKDENVPLEFLYHSLNFASLPWFSADSAVPGINRNVILQQKFIFPPIELIDAFRKISETIFQQNLNTRGAINSIESLRDVILPRLMSGGMKI